MTKSIKNLLLYGGLAVLALVIGFLLAHFKAPLNIAVVLGLSAIGLLIPVFIRYPQLSLAAVGFCLPFERVPSIDLGGATIKINHILILVALIVYLTTGIIRKKIRLRFDPIAICITLMLLAFSFSFKEAVNLPRSLMVFAFLVLMLIVYLTVTMVVQDKKTLILVVRGVLWGALVAGLLGVFQFFGDMVGLPTSITLIKPGYDQSTFGFARVMGASQEPLYFANYIFIPLVISILALIRGVAEEVFSKRLLYLLSVVLMIDFILALSRGAYLGGAVLLLVFLIVQAKIVFQLRIILPAILIIIFVFTGSFLAIKKTAPDSLDRFISHALVSDRTGGESVVSRVDAIGTSWELFKQKPVFGNGLGNYGPIVQNDPEETPEGGWFIVNNEYLEILAETGLVGGLSFALLIVVVFVRGIKAIFVCQDRTVKALMIAFLLALVGILVQYTSFSTLYIFHVWFLIGLIGASANFVFNQYAKKYN